MKQEALEKYNKERATLLKRFRKQKLLHTVAILSAGIAAITIVQLLGGFQFKNFPVTIAFSVVIGIFTITWLRVRLLFINRRMQIELLDLENRASDQYYQL